MQVQSYKTITTGATPIVPASIATGAANNSVIRSVEICNNSETNATVVIQRQDAEVSPTTYGTMTLVLEAGDYVVLFVGAQIILPADHVLQVGSDQDDVEIIANVIDL
jgi:hypothetical protein